MSEYGYLNHTSTDSRDEEAINAVFAAVPGQNIVIEQLWSPGEKRRPAFDALLNKLKPGDTLFIHSIDRLGIDADEIATLWDTITEDRQTDIVVLNDPALDSRKDYKPTSSQVRDSAQSVLAHLAQVMGDCSRPHTTFAPAEATTYQKERRSERAVKGKDGIRMISFDELIQSVSQKADTSPDKCRLLIDVYFEEASARLAAGSDIVLHPTFGYVVLKESGGVENGKNTAVTKKRYTPIFKSTIALKRRLKQSDEEYYDMLRAEGRERTAELLEKRQQK